MSNHVRGLAAQVMPPLELVPGAVPAQPAFTPVSRLRKPGDTVSDMYPDAGDSQMVQTEREEPVIVAQVDAATATKSEAPPARTPANAPSTAAAGAEDCAALGADGCGEAVGADADPVVGIWALLPLLALGGGGGGGGNPSLELSTPDSMLALSGGGLYRLPVDAQDGRLVGDFDASDSRALFRITEVWINGKKVENQDLFVINRTTGEVTLNQDASGIEACIGSRIDVKVVAEKDALVTDSKVLSLLLDAPSAGTTYTLGESSSNPEGDQARLDMLTIQVDGRYPALYFAWEGSDLHVDWGQIGSNVLGEDYLHLGQFDYLAFVSNVPNDSVAYYGYQLDGIYKIASAPVVASGTATVAGSACADLLAGFYLAGPNSTTALSLNGGAGDDVIIGSAKAINTLAGGAGDDLLIGGEKADTYIFDLTNSDHGVDWLVSFKVGDSISLELGEVDFNYTLVSAIGSGSVTDGDFSIALAENNAFYEFSYDGVVFAVQPLPPITYNPSAPLAA